MGLAFISAQRRISIARGFVQGGQFGMRFAKFGVQHQLALAVFLSVLFAALVICTTLLLFSQKRLYVDALHQSEQMVQAASLAFSQALADNDEVLLDAFIHELHSREELHVKEAYVLNTEGRVVAHSRAQEYGKFYPTPAVLTEKQRTRLSEIVPSGDNEFQVISLLQSKDDASGALIVKFSIGHLIHHLRSEMLKIVLATVPVLFLSAAGVTVYARRIVRRIKRLQDKALAAGRGELDNPIEVEGGDEIAQLTCTFNETLKNLSQLRTKDRHSAETIERLNRDLKEQLTTVVQLKEKLAEENAALRQELRNVQIPGEIIGAQGGLHKVIHEASRVAPLPITVLITGESGTGKELLASFVHNNSPRKVAPFIKVNCAALPPTLIESELFGHERGAFTGAVAQKKGKFELAHTGTLFLDEVGELALDAQAKLLRVLQQGEITRIGGHATTGVDVRVIAATNRDLAEAVQRGHFREDLYYRLKVVELHVPPLRERLEDLPALAQYFIGYYSEKLGRPVVGVSPSGLEHLKSYPWPGNVRELENVIARAITMAATQVLGAEDFSFLSSPELRGLPARIPVEADLSSLLAACGLSPEKLQNRGWGEFMAALEKICLQGLLGKFRNQREMAEALKLSPATLHRLIRKYVLDIKNKK